MFSSHGHIPTQTSTILPTAGYVGLCLCQWWMDFLGGCHRSAKEILNHSAFFWDDKNRLSSLLAIITSPCSLGVRPTVNRLGSWGYIWYKCQCNKSLTYNKPQYIYLIYILGGQDPCFNGMSILLPYSYPLQGQQVSWLKQRLWLISQNRPS